jgi:hypothetical protein
LSALPYPSCACSKTRTGHSAFGIGENLLEQLRVPNLEFLQVQQGPPLLFFFCAVLERNRQLVRNLIVYEDANAVEGSSFFDQLVIDPQIRVLIDLRGRDAQHVFLQSGNLLVLLSLDSYRIFQGKHDLQLVEGKGFGFPDILPMRGDLIDALGVLAL